MARKTNDPKSPCEGEPAPDTTRRPVQRDVFPDVIDVLHAAGMYGVHDAQREWWCYLCSAPIIPGDRFLCIARVFRFCASCAQALGQEGLP